MTDRHRAVGLVGACMIAPHHLDALAALPWVRVVGVTDLDRGRAEARSSTAGKEARCAPVAFRSSHDHTRPDAAGVARGRRARSGRARLRRARGEAPRDRRRRLHAARRRGPAAGHARRREPLAPLRPVGRATAGRDRRRPHRSRRERDTVHREYPAWGDEPVPPHHRDAATVPRPRRMASTCCALLGEIEGSPSSARGTAATLAFDEWHALSAAQASAGCGSWNARPLETYVVAQRARDAPRGRRAPSRPPVRARSPGPVGRTVNTLEDALPRSSRCREARSTSRLASSGRTAGFARRSPRSIGRWPTARRCRRRSRTTGGGAWVEEGARPADGRRPRGLARRRAAGRSRW